MRDAGLVAIGFVGGVAFVMLGLAAAIAEVERGRSIDALVQRLAARSWPKDVA